MIVNGYAYPSISTETLEWWLKRISWISTFSYGLNRDGSLINLDDEQIISRANDVGVRPIMVLTAMNDEGMFDETTLIEVLNNEAAKTNLIENIYENITRKGMGGVDFDFEYISAEYADDYVSLVRDTRNRISPYGYLTTVALAPKTSADQPGQLYGGHDYKGMGEAADYCLLMTYEWGYAYSEPRAISPIGSVRRVLDYAVTEIPPEKILMGLNNYGYDWRLPFLNDGSRAETLTLPQAQERARQYGAQIMFDEETASPYFEYTNQLGENHIVWFENEISWSRRIDLVYEYGLAGVGIWNIMAVFPVGV